MLGVKKMGCFCCVEGCTQRFKKGGSCTFYSFPRDDNIRRLWEKTIGRNYTSTSRVCSKHFELRFFLKNEETGHTWLRADAVPSLFIVPRQQAKNVGPKKVLNLNKYEKYLATVADQAKRKNESSKTEELPASHQVELVEPEKSLKISGVYSTNHPTELVDTEKGLKISEVYSANHPAELLEPKKGLKISEVYSANHPAELLEPEKGLKISEVYSANHPAELVEPEKSLKISEVYSANHPAELVEPKEEINLSEGCSASRPVGQVKSTKENSPTECSASHPAEQIEPIKEIDISEECPASSIQRIVYKPQGERYNCLDGFTKEDMNSPEKAQKVLLIATRLELENEEIKRKYRLLEKKVASLEDVIWKMQKGSKFAVPVQPPAGVSSSVEGNSTSEKQKTIPVESVVVVKKEPADPTPSTSNNTDKEEFILPHPQSSWTTPDSRLSVDNEPVVSDGGQLKKKQRTDSSASTSVSDSSVVSNHTVLSQSISNISSSSYCKNQFEGFGNYVADKLNCLDAQSALRAQKAIESILLEAEMGKYLDETQDIKPSIVPF